MTADERSSDPRATPAEKAVAALVAAGIAAEAARLVAAAWGFTTDDAWIPLRYARNLADGHGLLWNVGEPPVEGYSSFPFVMLGAAAYVLELDPIVVLKAISVASLAGTAVVLHALARTFVGPLAAVLPFAILVHDVGEIAWTVSGLETAVYQLLVAAAALATFVALGFGRARNGDATRPAPARAPLAAGALAGLAAVMRPEGPLVFGVLFVVFAGRIVVARRSHERAAERDALVALGPLVAGFAGIWGPYAIARLVYYERLLPNSVLCKMGYPADPWALDRAFWETSWPWILLALVRRPSRLDARHVVLLGVPLVYAIVLYDANPIVGHWNRHFLSALALLLVAAVAGLASLARLLPLESRLAREALVVVLVLAVIGWRSRDLASGLEAYAAYYAARQETRARVATWVNENVPADGLVVAGDVGLFGVRVRARILDVYCLNSPEMTRPPLHGDLDAIVDWVFGRAPDAIVLTARGREASIDELLAEFPPAYAARLTRDHELAAAFRTPGQQWGYFVFQRRPD